MNERLRLLREEMGISRAAFGRRIGVSGDVINNLERGRVEMKEHIVKLICSEFSVNEDWLRSGAGEMFLKTPSGTMEQLRKEFNLDDFSFNLVHEYLKLAPAQREKVRDFFYHIIAPEDNIDSITEPTVEELEVEYIKSRSGFVRKTMSIASNTTEQSMKKKNA